MSLSGHRPSFGCVIRDLVKQSRCRRRTCYNNKIFLIVFLFTFRSMEYDGRVQFSKSLMMTPEEAIALGWGTDLVSCTLDFVARLREIEMDRNEFCTLNAIVLTYPGGY